MLDRKQLSRPLVANQLIQKKLANMMADISLCLRLGSAKDEDQTSVEVMSLMNHKSCAKALDIARKAYDVLGGNGVNDELGVASC